MAQSGCYVRGDERECGMTSNYLPPFSAADRVDRSEDGASEGPAHPAPAGTEHEATYADFLGDQVED
jgi:hypothetical protein